MKIFYQRSRTRAAKTDMIVELTLREILGMIFARNEIRLETPHDSVVLRHGKA